MKRKTNRNQKIYFSSKIAGGTLTYRGIQKKYKFRNVKTAYDIVQNEHKKYAIRFVPLKAFA